MCRFWLFFLWIPQDLSEIKRNHQKNQKSVEKWRNGRLHSVKIENCEIWWFWLFFLLIPQDLSDPDRNHQKTRKSVEKWRNDRLHLFLGNLISNIKLPKTKCSLSFRQFSTDFRFFWWFHLSSLRSCGITKKIENRSKNDEMTGYTHISHVKKNELCEICRFWLFFLLIPQDLSEIKQNHQKNWKLVEKWRHGGIHPV